MRTYRLRLNPSNEQINMLMELSYIKKEIWNKLLDIEKKSYDKYKKFIDQYELNNILTQLRIADKKWQKLNSKACQTIATEMIGSYRSFFNLVKKDKLARPPRKIEDNNYHTISFNQSGWSIKDENVIIINKIPIKYKSKINLINLKIKEMRIKFIKNKWLLDFVIDEKIDYKDKLEIETRVLAIDLGLDKLGVGVDNKGGTIFLPNKSKKINHYFESKIKETQQKLSLKKKGSRKFRKLKQSLNKIYYKKNEQIKHTLHIQSKKLSCMNYNTIIVGDLKIKKLMNTEGVNKNKKGIRKSFHQSNINQFLQYLSYKCQIKNINLIKIGEQYTTQLNCLTGKMFDKKVELNDRIVELNDKITIDRDLNSAINILNRWFEHHLAGMNQPLDLFRVLQIHNLKETTTSLAS
jgi:putative transposase